MGLGDNMLLKFTVSNYKNFQDPITLNFTDTHDYKFNTKCVKNGLLSKVIIYGPNASGKSNLGYALFDIVGLLTDKHTEPRQLDEASFINADSDNDIAKFEYYFKKDDHIIRYAYEKASPKDIVYEELYIDDCKVYSYNFKNSQSDFVQMSLIGADSLNFEYFEKNFAVLRYIANNTIQQEGSYVKFIMNFVSHMLWFRSLQENGYIGLTTGTDGISEWIIDHGLVKEFQKFLHNIAGIDIELDVLVTQSPIPMRLLFEKHKNCPLAFDQAASNGTRALQLLFYWSQRFNEVSFLFMDEFDAFYHYELARNVIKKIVDLDNIQAVFTSHNSYLASNEILRPDCYFVLSKGKLISFADSTDRELREGHNLEKLLRNGEFDAK